MNSRVTSVFVAALLAVAGCLFPPDLKAGASRWWSAELQPGNAVPANTYSGSPGDVWNVLTVPAFVTMTTDPSWGLADNTGNGSGVAFSISGTISSYNGSMYGNFDDPIGRDYFLWDITGTSNPIGFQFSGLTPGAKYELTVLGADEYAVRCWDLRVDTNGNDNLGDETATTVACGSYSAPSPTVLQEGLIMLNPPAYLPPSRTIFDITASPSGKIIGDGTGIYVGFYTEADWAGFQLRQISDVPVWLPGDANKDGTVNGADLNIVLSNYNLGGMDWDRGDFNGDGQVNGADLNVVLSNYNQHLGASSAPGAPEPSTLLLAVAGLVGLVCYAWRKRRSQQ
jgi:hypothetical protein